MDGQLGKLLPWSGADAPAEPIVQQALARLVDALARVEYKESVAGQQQATYSGAEAQEPPV